MKKLFGVALGLVLLSVFMYDISKPTQKAKVQIEQNQVSKLTFEPIAVVELFTSQGCSSCPPADKLLSQIKTSGSQSHIFPLSFHVDYWNRLGWTDPFSKKQYSERQAQYVNSMHLSSAYTPQVVVNGVNEFVGSNSAALNKNIVNALKLNSEVSFATLSTSSNVNDESTQINYKLVGNYANCKINIAFVSAKETTLIKNGENEGLTIINENVVKYFVTSQVKTSGEAIIKIPNAMVDINITTIIAYVQRAKDNLIVGAASQKIAK